VSAPQLKKPSLGCLGCGAHTTGSGVPSLSHLRTKKCRGERRTKKAIAWALSARQILLLREAKNPIEPEGEDGELGSILVEIGLAERPRLPNGSGPLGRYMQTTEAGWEWLAAHDGRNVKR
jgi:hypothetical protein